MVENFIQELLNTDFIPDCVLIKIGENDIEKMNPIDIVAN